VPLRSWDNLPLKPCYEGRVLGMRAAEPHAPGIRIIAPPICGHVSIQTRQWALGVPGELRRAAVLTVISTPRLSSFLNPQTPYT
jgi:hypothetical protein